MKETEILIHVIDLIIQALINKVREVALLRGGKNPAYRKMQDLAACVRLRRMRNEDSAVVELAPQSKTWYLVNALDDLSEFGLDISFPEDLRTKYDLLTTLFVFLINSVTLYTLVCDCHSR